MDEPWRNITCNLLYQLASMPDNLEEYQMTDNIQRAHQNKEGTSTLSEGRNHSTSSHMRK
ncbi:hypothetical protein RchiOBHm_Chr6g0279201 [Rosa chinensis]|uniref:Uncharacterized protein n=1 Tax=Rosa chinensis TaxID=74649 RepID=A0A2P6PT15_ROSCH|nr:hypothetical protein RchiOBHm_Chr6g0279201 [Rosa chinensis]